MIYNTFSQAFWGNNHSMPVGAWGLSSLHRKIIQETVKEATPQRDAACRHWLSL